MTEMTKEAIVASCKANGGYAAPHLNDQLFLHCKGYTTIQNLDAYKEVKVLWLEQNALSELDGLRDMDSLVSLFLQNNLIRSFRTFSATLRNLSVLNISHNYISSLAGLAAACPRLETLHASHNQLACLEACRDLWGLKDSLTSVDLSFNRLEWDSASEMPDFAGSSTSPSTADGMSAAAAADEDEMRIVAVAVQPSLDYSSKAPRDPLVLVNFFACLPKASVICMHGNPISHGLRQYRRNMILHLPSLTYLDERPVFPEERRVVEAWGRGGEDAEAAERAAIRDEKQQHLSSCVRILTEKMDSHRAVRDRLTQEFDERRARELEELTQRRRQYRDERAALEREETLAREALEKVWQDVTWDLEETVEAEVVSSLNADAKKQELQRVVELTSHTLEAEGDMGDEACVDEAAAMEMLLPTVASSPAKDESRFADLPVTATSPLSSQLMEQLLQSDDAVLADMESEIQSVLFGLQQAPMETKDHNGTSTQAAASPRNSLFVREAMRAERHLHAAIAETADRLKGGESAGGRQSEADTWRRFREWERRSSRSQEFAGCNRFRNVMVREVALFEHL